MDFVKLSEQRFTAKKFDVNKKIPRDDVEKLKTILQLPSFIVVFGPNPSLIWV